MNRRTVLFAVPVTLAALALPNARAGLAGAQERPSADVVAARVQQFYDRTRTIQARFQQNFWNRVYDRTQTSRGRVAIRRPGEIRFDYEQPNGKVLVSSGGEWTMYEPGEGSSAGQYARGSSAAASQSAFGFLMGTADLRRFRRSLLPARSSDPQHTDALELRPRRDDPHYRRIRVYVDNRPESLGVVRRVSIEDHDGNWNVFDFVDIQFNRDLGAELFRFTPPAGAREIGGAAPRAEAPRPASAPLVE